MNGKVSRRVLARTIAAKLLAEPMKRTHWLRVLAAYLVEYKMTDDAGLIVNDISRELLAQGGQLSATVTSARPLSDDVRRELTRILKAGTGAQDVTLTEHTDPALIGGLVARTPDQELDMSVRSTLKQLAAIK
jgi:F-type H+-transporting ATPase subunit delta